VLAGGSSSYGAVVTEVGAPVEEMRRAPPAARLLPGRVHYGWWIAIGSLALLFVTVGVGYYGLAVFLRPLQDAHGWSNGVVSGATGLYFTVSGLTGAIIGPHIDRRGPLPLMTVGTLLLGGSVAAVGFVDAIWQLYAVYLLMAVGFGLTASIGVNAMLARWFVHKRARAMSIAFSGVSVGGIVLAPLGTALIDSGGLRVATIAMGILVVAVAMPVVRGLLVWDPAEMGLEPDAGAPPPNVSRAALGTDVQHRAWRRVEAMRTVAFWALLVGYVLVLLAQTGFLLHQISFLEDRLGSRQAASFALSVTALGSILARLAVGSVADRLDKRLLTVALFVIQATAVLLVVHTDNIAITYGLVLVIGFTIGNIYMMQTLLTSEIYGVVSLGTILGLLLLTSQLGSGIGPALVGLLEDSTGNYTVPFTVTSLLTYLAAVSILLARPPQRPLPH
jgi:sugar phosphate permease